MRELQRETKTQSTFFFNAEKLEDVESAERKLRLKCTMIIFYTTPLGFGFLVGAWVNRMSLLRS